MKNPQEIRITISTENAAFVDRLWVEEFARIICTLGVDAANDIDIQDPGGEFVASIPLRDINGNTVGACEFGPKPRGT